VIRAAIACGVMVGCSGGASAPTGDTFIAFSSTFADYATWNHDHSDGPAPGTQPDAVLGPREQYINTLPPADAIEFPIGTAIVEVRASGTIFAGVKRGGNFNPGGAVNWEWFELLQSPDVVIKWRGVGPPAGEMYGGDPDGGCNSCHAQCGATNDYVCSPYLQLGHLGTL